MAKYYRYMSFFEFLKLSLGEQIKPNAEFSEEYLTTSKGVCFFGDNSFDEQDENRKTLQALKETIGEVISNDFLVEFESTEFADIYESVGRYGKNEIPEYWMSSYDSNSMIPLRYKLATGNDLKKEDWIDYNRDDILQNPRSYLEQIANQRRSSKKSSITKIDDWCGEFSLLSGNDKYWYIERDKKNKTITLSYRNILANDKKSDFNLSFKQEEADTVHVGLEEYKIGNYSWNIDGDIPDEWRDLSERFKELSQKQVYSDLPYSYFVKSDRICSYDYSYAIKANDRISQLMKYAILKATYPDIIDKYKLSFDGANSGKVFEFVGLPVSSNPFQVPPLRLDTLRIIPGGFLLNNLYENNPVFFSSDLKNRKKREEPQIVPEIPE